MSRFAKKVLGYIEQNRKRYISTKKSLIMVIMTIMLILTCGRAYNVYVRYNEVLANENLMNNAMDDCSKLILQNIIEDANMKAYYINRIGTNNLEKDLLENHTTDELISSIVDNKFEPMVYNTIMNSMKKHFNSPNTESDNVLIIGTDKDVIFVNSTSDREKFNGLKGDKPLITWDYFFDKMENPKVTKEAFNKVKYRDNDHQPIIMRIDGDYQNNRIYTVNDLVKAYEKDGVEGLEGYGFLTLATITEDGDIFGNPDDMFMQSVSSTKKLYVYKYTDINDYIHDHLKLLGETGAKINRKMMEVNSSDTKDLLASTANVILNGVVIIGLMFLYKSIDEEDEENENIESDNR